MSDKLREQTEKGKAAGKEKNKRKKGVLPAELTRTALMTALLCAAAPMTLILPVSPVGLTFGTLLLYLTGLLLGPRMSCASVLLYLAIGFLGLPVFSGYTAGAGVLFGPTGGYLLGYLPCAFLVGVWTEAGGAGKKGRRCFIFGMLSGTLVLYLFGTLWFLGVYAEGVSFSEAVTQCVLPFLPFDFVKIILAAAFCAPLQKIRAWR